ncbi:MAG: 6-carboxytetrahydropterin synthase [Desulfurococcales archaeon]|nr:6-carboxytetrahydropterin synthase [Desulfurococcales archaeon]
MYRYCASRTVSVAMRIDEWGYSLHGHDVEVEACARSHARIDIELLRRELDSVLEPVDHRPLWEAVPGAVLLEDLLSHVCRRLASRLAVGVTLESVTARIPGASITLECAEGEL